jgi:hypothetical protein
MKGLGIIFGHYTDPPDEAMTQSDVENFSRA